LVVLKNVCDHVVFCVWRVVVNAEDGDYFTVIFDTPEEAQQ